MTDLEISKALALAIGWEPIELLVSGSKLYAMVGAYSNIWRVFDYRDEVIAFRIAQKYDCFPCKSETLGWWVPRSFVKGFHETPQKAIAMAVLEKLK